MERSSPRDVQMWLKRQMCLLPESFIRHLRRLPECSFLGNHFLSILRSVSKIKDVHFVANRKRSALPLGRSGLRREIREAWDHP